MEFREPATARMLMMGGYLVQHLWDPLTGDFLYDPAPDAEMGALGRIPGNFQCGHSLGSPIPDSAIELVRPRHRII